MLWVILHLLSVLRYACNSQSVTATFKGNDVFFTHTDYDRSKNWAIMIGEAHGKFKFRPGTIEYSPWDTSLPQSDILKKTYFQVCHKNYTDAYRLAIGPDWTSLNYPTTNIKEYTFGTYFILESSQKTPKYKTVGWNGRVHSPTPEKPEFVTRPMLLEFTAKYPHLFHFQDIASESSSRVEMSDLVADYAYLLDIGGNGYSGRLKYLMWSNRPILYVDRDYVEWFNEFLKPNVHYIPVKRDLSDLVSQTEWVFANPEKAAEIAQNALDFAVENLTHDAFLERIKFVVNNLLDQE